MKDTMRTKEVLNFSLYSIPGDPPVISLASEATNDGLISEDKKTVCKYLKS